MAAKEAPEPSIENLRDRALQILAENRIMAVATLRADGWPQATMVGYAPDGLALYFAIARDSQKLANMQRDARISIAIGWRDADGSDLRGLSMAADAVEVTAPEEIRRLNALIFARYPEQAVFAPRGASVAIIKATPLVVSIIDPRGGLNQAVLLNADPLTGALSVAE